MPKIKKETAAVKNRSGFFFSAHSSLSMSTQEIFSGLSGR